MKTPEERSRAAQDFLKKPLLIRYTTRDRKHLKGSTYKISYSGDEQYIGIICLSLWDTEQERYKYVTIVSDATRTSAEDAFSFCEEMKSKIIEKLVADYENNIYGGDLYRLRDDMKQYCKYKYDKNE